MAVGSSAFSSRRGSDRRAAAVGLHAAAAGRDQPVGNKPRRSVFIYIPHGVNTLTWQITAAGRDYSMSPWLKSLEKHRQNITPISGLYHPRCMGSAHVCADGWLTGAKLDMAVEGYKNSVSCDQLIAEVTGPQTRFSSLELSVAAGVGRAKSADTLAWTRDGMPMPAEANPRTIFDRLFGEEPGGIDARRRRLDRRHSILDSVRENAKSFRLQLGGSDRSKLDEYLTRFATWKSAPSGSTPG